MFYNRDFLVENHFDVFFQFSFDFCFTGKPVEQYRTELGRFGITGETALQSVMSLSGGQKCRLAFSLMCMKK